MTDRRKSMLVAAYVFLCILLGGSAQGVWTNLALELGGIALLAFAAIVAKPAEEGTRFSRISLLLIAAIVLVLIQLVPLPAGLWTKLPGREAFARGYQALGYALPSLPVSEAPYATVMTLFAFIPAVAAFVATEALRLQPRLIFLAIVVATILGVAVGALQVAGGPASWAYFYPITSGGAVGFFANGNHMGTLLLISIPLTAALVASAKSEQRASKWARHTMGIAVLVLVLIGIALNGSFAAFGLAIPVVIASAAVMPVGNRWKRVALPLASFLLLAGVVLLAVKPIGSDVLQRNPSTSLTGRYEIWHKTGDAIRDSFPVGTGLGTFVKAYGLQEDPTNVANEYVNHAHNDFLELILELGLPGAILLLLFLFWWGISSVRIWTSPVSTPAARAATIATGAVLAHSVVDFPLRTAAISAIFATCVALMQLQLGAPVAAKRGEKRPSRHVELR